MAAYALVSPKELSIFCKGMSVLFFSQITLLEGAQLLSEQSDNKHLKRVLAQIHEDVSNGFSFADAIGKHEQIFTPYLCNMVSIGEVSGTLDDVFDKLSVYFDKEYRLRKRLRSAAVYPLVLSALMLSVIVLMVTKIMPMFNDLLYSMGGEASALTAAMLSVSTFLANNTLIILLVIILLAIATFIFFRTEKGSAIFDELKMKTPIFKYIHTRVFTARFARSLSILLKSGVQLLNALSDIMPTVDNGYMVSLLEKTVNDVKDGKPLTEALKAITVFPPLFMRLLTIGQNTGHLDEMMDKAANVFDEEVDDAIEKVTALIEPALMIILSVVVGIILLSVMMPMINIMNAIG